MEFNFAKVEEKWQKKWAKEKIFEVEENSSSEQVQASSDKNAGRKKKKFYVAEMYPYPSGSGLHIGHAFNYTIGDIFARFKIMNGFNVLHPMGFDSFGLPAENAAIKNKSHPKKYTEEAIANFIRQQKALGLTYDWTRMVETHKPDYYKWDQWIFLKMFEKGLAFKKVASVNWCPKCNGVLANEQVHDGKCWVHKDTNVEIKHLEQWFFKTTNYADELYEGINKLENWHERIKSMQRNWIGKSNGTEIDFEIENTDKENFILLHGYTAKANGGFRPWLKKELESREYSVFVPNLPNTNNPIIKEQVDYVLENYEFNKDTVLLGHSLGSVVALKTVEQLKKPIKKLILASAFSNTKFKQPIGFEKGFDWKFNFEKIKSNVKEIIILKDISDEGISDEQTNELLLNLNCKIIKFKAEVPHIRGEQEPETLNACLETWPVFTTRPDTIFGVTFVVVSAQHPKLNDLVTEEHKKDVEKFLKKIKSTSEKDYGDLEKEGVFTGSYAINPMTNEKVPVYAGNFVVADYGSGMVMAVPAHDQRDFDFAEKYNIEKKIVIQPEEHLAKEKMVVAYTGNGRLINSGEFNNLFNDEAKEHITKYLELKKLGRKVVNYKLRDWLISRQRFWGTPIPIIYCDKCGTVPVPEKDLPVVLPEEVKFTNEKNPLVDYKKFTDVKCPKCGAKAKRETDTMDTFVNSSWYFFRYCDNKNKKEIFDKEKAKYWMPIDLYIGGAEHACMHLIYFRFYTKFLRDLGLTNLDEPTYNLFNQGMVHGADGVVMSKSRGNVVDPLDVIKKYSADTLRIFLVSVASPDKDSAWSDTGIESMHKFINKFINFISEIKKGKSSEKIESKINKAIKEITKDMEGMQYNLAIIKLRQLIDFASEEKEISKKDLEKIVKLISPFCPHITEELWEKLGNKNFISLEKWPEFDERKINEKLEQQEKIVDNLISDINNVLKIVGEKKKVFIYTLPNEKEIYKEEIDSIKKRTNLDVFIYAVNDKDKYDPENKSKKTKPGKPAIYLE